MEDDDNNNFILHCLVLNDLQGLHSAVRKSQCTPRLRHDLMFSAAKDTVSGSIFIPPS